MGKFLFLLPFQTLWLGRWKFNLHKTDEQEKECIKLCGRHVYLDECLLSFTYCCIHTVYGVLKARILK